MKEKTQFKIMDSFRIKNTNNTQKLGKGNNNFTDIKRMKSKVKLPSLGSNMYIIMTSTKLMNKN